MSRQTDARILVVSLLMFPCLGIHDLVYGQDRDVLVTRLPPNQAEVSTAVNLLNPSNLVVMRLSENTQDHFNASYTFLSGRTWTTVQLGATYPTCDDTRVSNDCIGVGFRSDPNSANPFLVINGARVDPGTTRTTLTVSASGFPNGIAAFDLTVSYNPGAVTRIPPVSFLGGLGPPISVLPNSDPLAETIAAVDTSQAASGLLEFFGVSLLDTTTLLGGQHGARLDLASIDFPLSADLRAPVFILNSNYVLSDTDGNSFTADVRHGGGIVLTPEPSSVLLFSSVVALAVVWTGSRTHSADRNRRHYGKRIVFLARQGT